MEGPELIPINEKIDISELSKSARVQTGSDPHKILMINAREIMKSKKDDVVFERSNIDVTDTEKKIVVECGLTSARKLLGTFNNKIEGIEDIKEFWILQSYDKNNRSNLYKFKKNK